MNYEESYKKALNRGERIIKSCIENDASNDVLVACVKQIFPELNENKVEKPNGGIVSEDFNESDGFYKVNLAYLNKEQVEEIENLVKKWNPEIKESKDDRVRKGIIKTLMDLNSDWIGLHGVTKKDAIAWIEGEQKPTWTENDELMFKDTLGIIETGWSVKGKSHLVCWLKSIKDKIIEYNKK